MDNEKQSECEGCKLRDKRIRDLEQMIRTIAEAVDEAEGRIKADLRDRDLELLGRATWQKNGL